GPGPAGAQLGQRRDGRADLRDDRATGVGGLELAELPLAAEQPQRVVDAGLETGRELAVARGGLEPCPVGHQALTRVRSVVTVSASGADARSIAGRNWPR